jgi:1-acyl-sn-glycerol-3-phosphate acyltransferase
VPAVVMNSALLFKWFGRGWQRPQVTVRFGEPIYLTGNPDDPADTRNNTTRIMRAIAALLPPEMRGFYGEEKQAELTTEMEGEEIERSRD